MDMNLLNIGASAEGKMRIIQETVPGKQVTLAHIIASPGEIIYQKLGLNPELDYKQSAIGILSMCPSEISVIARGSASSMPRLRLDLLTVSAER